MDTTRLRHHLSSQMLIGSCVPSLHLPLTYGRVIIVLNFPIFTSSAGRNSNWGNKVAMNTFISAMLNRYPKHDWLP